MLKCCTAVVETTWCSVSVEIFSTVAQLDQIAHFKRLEIRDWPLRSPWSSKILSFYRQRIASSYLSVVITSYYCAPCRNITAFFQHTCTWLPVTFKSPVSIDQLRLSAFSTWNRALLNSQKKTKFRLALSLSLLRRSCPISARTSSGQCSQSTPNFIQIGWLPAEL